MDRRPRSTGRPVVRRDAQGNERTAPDWETLTERLIREAQEAGAFDRLPGQGRRLDLVEDHFAGDMASAHRLLRNAGAAPPWIEVDKEVRTYRDHIEALFTVAERSAPTAHPRLERDLETLASAHDQAVSRLESLAPGPRQHRRPVDRVELRRRLAAVFSAKTTRS